MARSKGGKRPRVVAIPGRNEAEGSGRGSPSDQRTDTPRGRAARRIGRRPAAGDGSETLFGLHAVAAALANPARDLIHLTATEAALEQLGKTVDACGLQPEVRTTHDLTKLLGNDTVHQGVALKARTLQQPALGDLAHLHADRHGADGGPPRVLVLDQVTDPHNVGAIIRSAAAFGAAGVVTTRRNTAPLGGVTAKAASGGVEHVPVVQVGNLAQALRDLARDGYRVVGLDGEGEHALSDIRKDDALALVLGAEGPGMRRLTRETCDFMCRLPVRGGITSLNVSNAAAVALALTQA